MQANKGRAERWICNKSASGGTREDIFETEMTRVPGVSRGVAWQHRRLNSRQTQAMLHLIASSKEKQKLVE